MLKAWVRRKSLIIRGKQTGKIRIEKQNEKIFPR